MNYKQLCELADSITESAARMIDLASVLRRILDEHRQSVEEWQQLEARIEAEIKQLEKGD
jgi:hypothetical protein